MAARFDSVDAYVAAQSERNRAALNALRRTILSAAPGAHELISYNIPAFRTKDGTILFIGAAARHCAIYAVSQAVVDSCSAELSGFETSGKGTIRFKPDAPVQAKLVTKIVRLRLAEMAARKSAKEKRL